MYANMETLTYNPDAVDSSVQKVRLAIGDTDAGSGVRPDGRNFSNVELATFVTACGASWLRAVPLVLQTLATEYANAGRRALLSVDPEMVKTADQYAKIAAELRLQVIEWKKQAAELDGAEDEGSSADAIAFGDTDGSRALFQLPPVGVL